MEDEDYSMQEMVEVQPEIIVGETDKIQVDLKTFFIKAFKIYTSLELYVQ